ncbi:MAG TPA: catalase, partial [Pseudomonadales bacterium]|nr:catalase [Pseudomonadales bacterium]
MLSPKKAIDVINARYGVHPGHRALHAKGILGAGTFTATPEAAQLCTAAHLQGDPVRVTVRLSNAGGNPKVPDYAPDVRGIGIKFYLPDGSTTDIVAQTAPRFPVKTPGAFIEMVAASERTPAGLLRLPWFLARNLRVIPSLRENLASLQLPASYASVPYYAIHAFRWTSPTGDQAHVRYTVLPELDLGPLNPVEARKGGRDYLSDDLRRRLDEGPVRFRLQVQVAEPGDDVDDPRS